jgi:predicted ATPase/transcriptional regulator with XRE-family HTH domain
MNTSNAQATSFSSDEEDFRLSLSEWLKRRRQELDLTQEQLAQRASCSVFAIRKIEMGERRPSRQLAEHLAKALEIPAENQPIFIQVARGERRVECLHAVIPGHASLPAGEPRPTTGNLRRSLTPFIGRDPELTALGRLLHDPQCSLITIVGPGGIGKTRLAIEAAQHIQDLFPDGIWFVPLAPLNSPALIVPTIADAVDFKFSDPTNHQAQLLRYLHRKRALLVLDNAEHLLDGVEVFTEILKHCPQVKLLVTSRERLNLLSEWVFEVQGLPVPANEQVEQMEAYSSVALFLQSARRVRAGFELREERQWVRKICAAMEGMPLGIELSAAWVGLLSCEEIAKEIERNLDFLTASTRDLPERHRSMRATLDHSWKLLNDEEKSILSRLSVFHGQFKRVAAEEICGANFTVLSSLRNKTLLYRTDQDYFSLHELVRQYAERKLAEDPGEQERVQDRHATYYVYCLSEWEKALKSSRQVETFDEMAQVIGNLARGWQRMITSFQPKTIKSDQFHSDLFNRSLFSLSLFYEMRCRSLEALPLFKESVAYLKSIQSAFEKTEDRSIFYSVLGHTTAYLGLHHYYIHQYEQTRSYLEEAIQLLEKSQSRVVRAQAQVMLASLFASQGHLQTSATLLEQSRDVFREEEDSWWYALSTIHLGITYISLDKLQESEVLFQEGFELIEPGDLRLGLPLRSNFAYILNLKKDFARAEQLLQENLQLSYQFKNFETTASILFEMGRVALATQRIELAIEYIQKSLDLLSELGETKNLPMHHLYLGKCLTARSDLPAAHDQFREVIKTGQEFKHFQMVYWGLVNNGRIYMLEGQTEKALGIALALRHYPIEFIRIKEEGDRLLADLRDELPQWQVEAAMQQVDSQFSPDPAGANALAYALKRDME